MVASRGLKVGNAPTQILQTHQPARAPLSDFLRWHNLKEDRDERIVSPLLLLPVEVTRKKGVRDQYVVQADTTEAEVNPVLRQQLRQRPFTSNCRRRSLRRSQACNCDSSRSPRSS